jgi:hypothetical protein
MCNTCYLGSLSVYQGAEDIDKGESNNYRGRGGHREER